jgi:anaerobic magnesium-protoporphyrin IX monomethyl ester cyclase
MMHRILFTHSYFLSLDKKQKKAGNAYPPLGTLYAASLIRNNGFEVRLFDSMLASSPIEIADSLERFQPDVVVIYDDGFNYLTKMCLTNMREAAFTMAAIAKQRGCKVIVCSSDSTDHYGVYLENGADYIIFGEGEMTLLDVITKLSANQPVDLVPGIAFQHNEEVINTGRRGVIRNLDELPLPAWDLVNIQSYRSLWNKKQKYFSLNITASRGCTFKCNWCAKPLFGNRYHARSVQSVINELKVLVNDFGAEHIWFCDDIFGIKAGWVKEFAELVQKENLQFKFKIQSRADLLLEKDVIKYLKQAGCDEVWIGAESGSQKILDAMEKGTTVEQIYMSRMLLKKFNIKSAFFLQFGYPGEIKEDIDATLKMVMDLLPENIGISVTYPLPGTKLYNNVQPQLNDKKNWKDSDDLAMMFVNTYPKEFYKILQRYVHSRYREKQSYSHLSNFIKDPAKRQLHNLYKGAYAFYFLVSRMIKQRQLKKFQFLHEGSF